MQASIGVEDPSHQSAVEPQTDGPLGANESFYRRITCRYLMRHECEEGRFSRRSTTIADIDLKHNIESDFRVFEMMAAQV